FRFLVRRKVPNLIREEAPMPAVAADAQIGESPFLLVFLKAPDETQIDVGGPRIFDGPRAVHFAVVVGLEHHGQFAGQRREWPAFPARACGGPEWPRLDRMAGFRKADAAFIAGKFGGVPAAVTADAGGIQSALVVPEGLDAAAAGEGKHDRLIPPPVDAVRGD